MSLRDFKSFIHAAEHNRELRRRIKGCKDNENLISLAQEYGFSITNKDFNIDSNQYQDIEAWFQKSIISPIKKSH